MAFLFVRTFFCLLLSFSLKQSNLLLLYGYLYSMSCPHLSPIITVCPCLSLCLCLFLGFGSLFYMPAAALSHCPGLGLHCGFGLSCSHLW